MCSPCVGRKYYPNRACVSHGTCPIPTTSRRTRGRPRSRGRRRTNQIAHDKCQEDQSPRRAVKRHKRQAPPDAQTPAKRKQTSNITTTPPHEEHGGQATFGPPSGNSSFGDFGETYLYQKIKCSKNVAINTWFKLGFPSSEK